MARKTRPTPIHTGFCRFTERSVEVFKHGHGIKLSIRTSDAEGDVVSVFLDAGDLNELTGALGNVTGRGSDRLNQIEYALAQLSTILHRNGF